MITEADMLAKIEAANQFIDRSYLASLNDYAVSALSDKLKRDELTALYHVSRMVYDKNEDVCEKLVSVFNSVAAFCRNIVMILKGVADHVDLYIGTRSRTVKDTGIAGSVLHDSFSSNFPGSIIESAEPSKVFFTGETHTATEVHEIAYVNIIPSERSGKQGSFVQGLEKFVDAMKGKEYICEFLASPVKEDVAQSRTSGFEELYSALFPFSKHNISHGHNEGSTLTQSVTQSISQSITTGISRATGSSTGYNRGKNSGYSTGMFLLMNFGTSSGTQEGWQQGATSTDSENTAKARSSATSVAMGSSQTTGTTDNLTIEFRSKGIENLLEKLDRHIKRMKSGSSYGVWETAAYFIAGDKTTATIAANTYRSLLLGEDTGTEKANFTLFDASESKTANIEESLRFCEHPLFRVPEFDTDAKSLDIEPSNYINGRELAMLMNFPRKSVSGIMVTEMAEFGRNVLISDSTQTESLANMGCIFHMGRDEDKNTVALNLDTLTSHCFITGSTGSGKSNTVYRLLEEASREPYKIPFLVIEPAKGEYRDEFRKVPGINLFSTNPYIDQTLKLNPFSFCDGIHILEHLDRVVEIFNGCWEMYAAMPAILKESIERAYENKGWDLLNSIFTGEGEPVFPTFADVLRELPEIISSSDYSADTKGDYIGALVTRVNSMTNGIYGQIFCDEFEVDNATLFDENAVVDLSRVGSSETKSLIMGIIILKLTEYRMTHAEGGNEKLKHITVLEEAHNILKNAKNSASSSVNNSIVAKSVDMIVNSIAEMRTYGECFVIVDQSPTSVDIAAIKNTNTKIIMRLPESEDCGVAGHSVSLNEQQIGELARLERGVAVVMQTNWAEPVLAKIHPAKHSFSMKEKPVTFAELKQFRSMVIAELVSQFLKSDEYDIRKIIAKVEQFSIIPAKKKEMSRMLEQFGVVMVKKFNSILAGRTLLRLAGCDDAFKRAEKFLEYERDPEGSVIEHFTSDSVDEWRKRLDEALMQYLFLDGESMTLARKYMMYSKRFSSQQVSYTALYKQIF